MDVLPIISCTPRDARLRPLIGAESLAALRFSGDRRLIDFWLAALRAAGISRSGIVLNFLCRDLVNHLFAAASQGTNFFFLPQPQRAVFSPAALRQNRDLLFAAPVSHILLISCSAVCVPDIQSLFSLHTKSGADATLLYAPEAAYAEHAVSLRFAPDGTVGSIMRDGICQGDRFLGCMLLRREVFSALLECREGHEEFLDLLAAQLSTLRVCALPHCGFYAVPHTPGAYLHANLNLPVMHGLHAENIRNSICFPGTAVGFGSALQSCLLLPGAKVGAGCELEYVICDEGAVLQDGIAIRGQPRHPFILCGK